MQGKLREHTDFKQDSLIYGPIGENRLKEILLEKGYRVEDISDRTEFMPFDIDILQFRKDIPSTTEDVLAALRNNQSCGDAGATGYEVKTDTFGIISRNIVWEDISNSNPGCMARCKADFLFYVFIDKERVIREEYLIVVRTLRRWLMEHFNEINKVPYLQSKSMQRGRDNTGIFLINIDKLVEEHIAKKL